MICRVFLLRLVSFGQATTEPPLPVIVLVGDSIRLSYAPIIASQLAVKTRVVNPKLNGDDSSNVLKHLQGWGLGEKPDVVHFNCGIHDTKRFLSTGKFQISPEEYKANLRQTVETIRKETNAVVIFGTTTPILDERAAATRQAEYALLNASVRQYNEIALRVMTQLKVPVNDRHDVLVQPTSPLTTDELIKDDGVHLTPKSQEFV